MSQKSIAVDLHITEDGRIRPLRIHWHDRSFEIDRLLDVRPGASLKIGCAGTRYTCRIRGKMVYLYEDNGIWFVESAEQ